jgi:hypothetical protein
MAAAPASTREPAIQDPKLGAYRVEGLGPWGVESVIITSVNRLEAQPSLDNMTKQPPQARSYDRIRHKKPHRNPRTVGNQGQAISNDSYQKEGRVGEGYVWMGLRD